MKISETFDFWGLSERNVKVKDFIKKNNFDNEEIFIADKEYINSDYTVSLIFKSGYSFKHYYYTPKEHIADSDESFFIGFNIGDFYGNPNFPFELPLNLTFNDNYEKVKKKLNKRSSKAVKTAADSVFYQFNFEKFYVLAYFNKHDQLIYLVVKLFEKSELSKIELQNSFKIQNKNLRTENITSFDTLKIQKPTFKWKDRMLEGDTIFNTEIIVETSKQLDEFIHNLKDAVLKRNSKLIYNQTKKFVKSINKLNKKYSYFIETTEREELCEFIDKCIRVTGFEIEKGFDITEEWREW